MLYKLRNMQLGSNAKALDKAKKKATIMVFIVLALCLFCWTPFHLSTVVALTTDLSPTPLVIGISYFITCLSYANSCLNPIVYALVSKHFRKGFQKVFSCALRRRVVNRVNVVHQINTVSLVEAGSSETSNLSDNVTKDRKPNNPQGKVTNAFVTFNVT